MIAFMEIAGMLLNNIKFWFFVDVLVILVCGTAGIILTKENSQEENSGNDKRKEDVP